MTDKALHETDGGGVGKSQSPKVENQDRSLWWVGGFLLALIALATVLAII